MPQIQTVTHGKAPLTHLPSHALPTDSFRLHNIPWFCLRAHNDTIMPSLTQSYPAYRCGWMYLVDGLQGMPYASSSAGEATGPATVPSTPMPGSHTPGFPTPAGGLGAGSAGRAQLAGGLGEGVGGGGSVMEVDDAGGASTDVQALKDSIMTTLRSM